MAVPADDSLEATLRRLKPTGQLPAQHLAELVRTTELLEFKRGQLIFRQGDRDGYAYFLVDGEIELRADGELVQRVVSGTERAEHALAQLQPRQLSAVARRAVRIARLDRALLERLVSMSGVAPTLPAVAAPTTEEADDDWMSRMLESDLFTRVPAANLQRIFTRMESIAVEAGTIVVQQGSRGDYYYVVQSGRCVVTRRTSSGGAAIKLAELGPGDAFGEEALVSDARRNATVTMASAGDLMRLTREDFIELIRDPLLRELDAVEAAAEAAAGACWLDVRFKDEHSRDGLPGSLNVPLNVLRLHAEKLQRDRRYIVCCDSGQRAAVGAFLLVERGFDAAWLRGGLAQAGRTPAADDLELIPDSADNVVPFPPAAGGPVPLSQLAADELLLAGRIEVGSSGGAGDDVLEAAVRAEALRVELARASMQLEEARWQKSQADAARSEADRLAAQARSQERAAADAAARSELDRLAQAAQAAEERLREETRRRAQAETAVEAARERERQAQVEREAQARERDSERRQAEAAAREREEARQRAAAEAEARLAVEREQLAAEAGRAAAALQEAERLRAEVEAAKRAADAEVERRRTEEEARIQALQAESARRLREEQARVEALYRWREEEIAQLQRMKAEAEIQLAEQRAQLEAATKEATRRLGEARRIEREVEQTRLAAAAETEARARRQSEIEGRLKTEVKTRVDAERRRLEAELARNAEQLAIAQREKAAAEAARRAAADEAEQVIAEFKAAQERMRATEESQLAAERGRLEAEAAELRMQLEGARRAREEAEAAHAQAAASLEAQRQVEIAAGTSPAQAREHYAQGMQVLEAEASFAAAEVRALEAAQAAVQVEVQRNRSAADELQGRLQRELNEWLHEQDEFENSQLQRQVLADQREFMERIKRRAVEARELAKAHNQSLLDDVAERLRKPGEE